jgi:hypothetical protein
MTITRILVAALAIGALAVPTASAKPVEDIHAPLAEAAAKTQKHPDLGAVNAPGATAVDSATDGTVQDLRRLRAGATFAQRPATAPTWPVNPQPLTPTTAVDVSGDDGGIDWTTVGLSIAGSFLAAGGIAALVAGGRRVQRQRATA